MQNVEDVWYKNYKGEVKSQWTDMYVECRVKFQLLQIWTEQSDNKRTFLIYSGCCAFKVEVSQFLWSTIISNITFLFVLVVL